jgi:UDP-hydrolysing UDP-N-acetyl-D-glucosamine 2-epimerase
MSNKRKICVAITARPSYSRIRTALSELRNNPEIELIVFCSGSALLERYGEVVKLIKSDGFNVVQELYTFVEGNEPVGMALTASNTITQTANALRNMTPDYVITIADRYETIGTAIAAAYLGIPLIHIQGGEITGNIDEKVRHAVTKLADYHLVSNERSANRLHKMGEAPERVFVTGCPSIDIAKAARKLPIDDVQKLMTKIGVGSNIDLNKDYIVLLQHPETDSYHLSFEQMQSTLTAIDLLGIPTMIFWPNIDAGSDATSKCLRMYRETNKSTAVHFVKNMEGQLFLRLLAGSKCLLGNSSVGLRECAYLGVPVVNIGTRQRGRDRSNNVKDVSFNTKEIVDATAAQIKHGPYPQSLIYGDGTAGTTIASVISKLPNAKIEKNFYE